MPTLHDRHTHILSATPTRTRIRVSAERRAREEIDRVTRALQARPEVYSVRPNYQTGSIVIHHRPDPDTLNRVTATLHDLGVILFHAFDTEVPLLEGKSAAARSIFTAAGGLNEQVGRLTEGMLDLRFLLPLGLAGLSLHQLLKNGPQIETAPWYVLAYYAFDSFLKLHQPSNNQPSTVNDGE